MKFAVKFIAIIATIILINGCQIDVPRGQVVPPARDDKVIIEQPPKIVETDWQLIMQPLINELLSTMNVSANNTLLISDINNRSDQYVSSASINNVITNDLKQQTIFKVVDSQLVNQAKQQLGISSDDSLVSRGKMIALARQLQTDYLLFTTINDVPQSPKQTAKVAMELLLTKTGEIVWQFSSDQLTNYQGVD